MGLGWGQGKAQIGLRQEGHRLWKLQTLPSYPFSAHALSLSLGNRAHFVYGIACDHGCIWDLKFCPSGAWELPGTPRKVLPT